MSARCTDCGADVAVDELHTCLAPALLSVYVAAPLGLAPLAERFAVQVRGLGLAVVSNWHGMVAPLVEQGEAVADPRAGVERESIANACLDEVSEADVLVAFTTAAAGSTLVEIGAALGQGKPVLWVQRDGKRWVMDSHTDVTRLVANSAVEGDAIAAALEVLDGMRREA